MRHGPDQSEASTATASEVAEQDQTDTVVNAHGAPILSLPEPQEQDDDSPDESSDS